MSLPFETRVLLSLPKNEMLDTQFGHRQLGLSLAAYNVVKSCIYAELGPVPKTAYVLL